MRRRGLPGLPVSRRRESLFDAVGGKPTLDRVHKRFYDKVYAHPWLGRFFAGHSQEAIEFRQTQFMGQKMGGPMRYAGHALELAHRRMFIPRKLLLVRQALLREALEEEGLAPELIERWLRIDRAFWKQVENDSLESFRRIDLKYEQPLIVPEPENTYEGRQP